MGVEGIHVGVDEVHCLIQPGVAMEDAQSTLQLLPIHGYSSATLVRPLTVMPSRETLNARRSGWWA